MKLLLQLLFIIPPDGRILYFLNTKNVVLSLYYLPRNICFYPLFFLMFLSVRLYDINTLQCFVSSNPDDQHLGALTSVSGLFFFTMVIIAFDKTECSSAVRFEDSIDERLIPVAWNNT